MINKGFDNFTDKSEGYIESFGDLFVRGFHLLALFAIGATIVWSASSDFFLMVSKGKASIEDILLLFIYLELGAMVGIYFKTNHMPVRFLVYVAITALTRLLIGMINVDHVPDMKIIIVTGAILILAASALILRMGSYNYPSENKSDDADLTDPEQAE
jgi:phosphate starvation-inducible membrane PsiE